MFISNDSAIPGIYTKDRNVGKDSHYQGCHMMLFTAHSAVKPEDTEGLGIFVCPWGQCQGHTLVMCTDLLPAIYRAHLLEVSNVNHKNELRLSWKRRSCIQGTDCLREA